MASLNRENLPEVFVSNSKLATWVSREVKKGHLRKLAPRLYTKNFTDSPEKLIKRHLWPIVASFFPSALIADRTAIENAPSKDGSIFLIATQKSTLKLPGITIKSREGPAPLPSDKPFINGLFLCSSARAYLENMQISRARVGIARTLSRSELEERIELMLQRNGEQELNRLREEMRIIAPLLELQSEFSAFEALIGTLLGTKEIKLFSKAAQARFKKLPYDSQRLDLFQILRDLLVSTGPHIRPERKDLNVENLAFFEAYFSNFIEGTEFSIQEAHEIVFDGRIPQERPEDAHDVLGTYRLVSDLHEMEKIPQTFDELLSILLFRHQTIMEGRTDKAPGKFKSLMNRAGSTVFVNPELVKGTLEKGFEIYQTLKEPFHRAVFMMFFIAEIHPFADGNGRVARIMMNAELVTAAESRIIIPTIYRNNYLVSLKALSQSGKPSPLIRTLDFAQKYTSAIDWSHFLNSQKLLESTHAFVDPFTADMEGIRLVLP